MGWSIGFDSNWNRDIGYGVPAYCDHPGCDEEIDRGLAYVCCEQAPYGGDGCGLYFCPKHSGVDGKCVRCLHEAEPFDAKPDAPIWINWKLTDKSWDQWRQEHPEEVEKMRATKLALGQTPDLAKKE